MENVPDRIQWTVNLLEVAPSDRILEIGCGNGTAVSVICEKLIDGTITAVDQSEKMIQAARKKNAVHESAGKVKLISAGLHEADFGQSRFHKIFAVNVNLFWQQPERELKIIRERLLPQGTLYVINQPPAESKIRSIEERTCQNLVEAGFTIKQVIVGDQQPVPCLCVITQ